MQKLPKKLLINLKLTMTQNSTYSYRKLYQKLIQLTLFLFTIFIFAQSAPPPVEGDYRSKITGNWTEVSTWEIYICTGGVCAWIPATTVPGVGTTATAQGNYNVFITQGTEVTVNTSQTYYFGNLYILANNPVLNVFASVSSGPDVGRINLENGPIEFKLLGDNQNIYIFGGVFYFKTLSASLGLRSGNSIVITDYNALGTESGLGSNGLQQLGITCTGDQKIKFYNSDGTLVETEYGVCASSSPYNFVQLNNFGGSLAAQLQLYPLKVCVGDTKTPVNLTAHYTGLIPPGKNVTYELKLESGPAGYNFPTLSGSFVSPGNAASIPDPSLGADRGGDRGFGGGRPSFGGEQRPERSFERRDDQRGERSFGDRGGNRGGFGGGESRGGFGGQRRSDGPREGGDFGRKSFGGGREGGFRGGESRGFGGGDRRPAFGQSAGKPYQPQGERGGDRGFERKPRAPRRDER